MLANMFTPPAATPHSPRYRAFSGARVLGSGIPARGRRGSGRCQQKHRPSLRVPSPLHAPSRRGGRTLQECSEATRRKGCTHLPLPRPWPAPLAAGLSQPPPPTLPHHGGRICEGVRGEGGGGHVTWATGVAQLAACTCRAPRHCPCAPPCPHHPPSPSPLPGPRHPSQPHPPPRGASGQPWPGLGGPCPAPAWPTCLQYINTGLDGFPRNALMLHLLLTRLFQGPRPHW